MNESSFPSIISQIDAVSPEAYRAQRMAELEQIAKYRAKKLKRYKDWADPVKRAAIQAALAGDLEISKEIFVEKISANPDAFFEPETKRFYDRIRVTELKKFTPEAYSLYRKICGWFGI